MGRDDGLQVERRFRAPALLAGPVWINVNWFLVHGLRRCALTDEAEESAVASSSAILAFDFTQKPRPPLILRPFPKAI